MNDNRTRIGLQIRSLGDRIPLHYWPLNTDHTDPYYVAWGMGMVLGHYYG